MTNHSKTLVVYYSHTGNTKRIADKIAAAVSADTARIETVVPYTGTPEEISAQGQREVRANIAYYMNNARIIREGLAAAGLEVYGGVNAPYIWLKTPDGMGSWEFFAHLLYDCHVVGTPGVGFGPCGEGYLRLTAFGNTPDVEEAIERIKEWKM